MYMNVVDFHEKFKLPPSVSRSNLPEGMWDFRLICAMEESKELEEATKPVDILDALIDLAYFSIGTVYICGCTLYDLNPVKYEFTFDELKAFHKFGDGFDELVKGNALFFVDVAYACRYHARQMNWDFDRPWMKVHLANMSKIRAKRPEDSKRGSGFDVVKPIGWRPADLGDCV